MKWFYRISVAWCLCWGVGSFAWWVFTWDWHYALSASIHLCFLWYYVTWGKPTPPETEATIRIEDVEGGYRLVYEEKEK